MHRRVAGRGVAAVCLAATFACGNGITANQDSSPPLGRASEAVIYGEDDRVEAESYPDATLVRLSRSLVGALVPREYLSESSEGNYVLTGPTLAEHSGLCPEEPLGDQLAVAICSAILSSQNTIVTAGHCVSSLMPGDVLFIRGYALGDAFPTIAREQVHTLGRVLAFRDGNIAAQSGDDVGIVELETEQDLPAIVIDPLAAAPYKGDGVVVVGTSEGIPQKIEGGGHVFDASPSDYFEITSDTFQGGSGSAVFSSNGVFLGIVVGGAVDYQWDETRACNLRNRLETPSDRGELVVRSRVIAEALSAALDKAEGTRAASCSTSRRPSDQLPWPLMLALGAGAWVRRRTRFVHS